MRCGPCSTTHGRKAYAKQQTGSLEIVQERRLDIAQVGWKWHACGASTKSPLPLGSQVDYIEA